MDLSGGVGRSSWRGPRSQRCLECGFSQHGTVPLGRRYRQGFDQFVMQELRRFSQGSLLDALGQQRTTGNEPSTAISFEIGRSDSFSRVDPQLELQDLSADRFPHPRCRYIGRIRIKSANVVGVREMLPGRRA